MERGAVGQQRRALTPERSGLHLWGSELRAWRDRRRLSLAGLGDLIRYDPSYLGRLERAEQFPPEHLARACDSALDTAGELVRLWHLADRERRQAAGHVASQPRDVANNVSPDVVPPVMQAPSEIEGDEVVVPCRALDGRIIWVSIPRRAFLLGGLGAAGLAAGIAAASPSGPSGSVAVRLRAAPGGAAEVSPVEHLQLLRRTLIDSDNLLGSRHVIPAAHGQIQVIQQLRAGCDGADRLALLRVQAQYAEFAGWLHQDSSDFRAAQFWLDRALEWSHAAGDHELATYVMARKSQLAGDMRDAAGAVDLAAAAGGMARRGSKLQATAATYGAHGYALNGQTVACLRAIDGAREMAADLDDDPASPWATWLDGAYIEVQRGRCLSVLGEHQQAAAVFQQAIRELPQSFRRDRGVYLAREALAHAAARDPEQAADTGMQALVIAHDTQSGRIIDELARVDADLAPWATLPDVADFRDALTSMIPSERN